MVSKGVAAEKSQSSVQLSSSSSTTLHPTPAQESSTRQPAINTNDTNSDYASGSTTNTAKLTSNTSSIQNASRQFTRQESTTSSQSNLAVVSTVPYIQKWAGPKHTQPYFVQISQQNSSTERQETGASSFDTLKRVALKDNAAAKQLEPTNNSSSVKVRASCRFASEMMSFTMQQTMLEETQARGARPLALHNLGCLESVEIYVTHVDESDSRYFWGQFYSEANVSICK